MTSGYPTDATENSVQANIVAAKYAAGALTSGPAVSVGSSVSFKATTPGYTTDYLTSNGTTITLQPVSSSSNTTLQQAASWTVVTGLGNSGCVSFESKATSGSYIRHDDFVLRVDQSDGTQLFNEDATFCPQAGLSGTGSSIRSWSYPTRYFRHYNEVGYIASNGGPETFDSTTSFNDDVTFVVGTSFA